MYMYVCVFFIKVKITCVKTGFSVRFKKAFAVNFKTLLHIPICNTLVHLLQFMALNSLWCIQARFYFFLICECFCLWKKKISHVFPRSRLDHLLCILTLCLLTLGASASYRSYLAVSWDSGGCLIRRWLHCTKTSGLLNPKTKDHVLGELMWQVMDWKRQTNRTYPLSRLLC